MNEKVFTTSWFRSSAVRPWTRKLMPLAGRPIHYLEVGVFEAQSSCWMLENVLTNEFSHAYLVDIWQPTRKISAEGMEERYQRAMSNLKPYLDTGRVTVYRESSFERVPKFPDNFFDLAYIDGNHEYDGVKADAINTWPKLKPGGVIIFDDYRPLRTSDGVTTLVNEMFLNPETKIDCEWFYETSRHQAFVKPVKPGDVPSVIADYTLANLHAKPNERPGAADAPGPGGV